MSHSEWKNYGTPDEPRWVLLVAGARLDVYVDDNGDWEGQMRIDGSMFRAALSGRVG